MDLLICNLKQMMDLIISSFHEDVELLILDTNVSKSYIFVLAQKYMTLIRAKT